MTMKACVHLWLVCLSVLGLPAFGAVFDGNSRVSVTDTTGGLSWNNNAGAKALTVSCWFKISLQNGGLNQSMVILANTTTGDFSGAELNSTHAYALFLNHQTGNVDFSNKGPGGAFSKTLIERPYLERWYHVAVVMSNAIVTGYVDGRKSFQDASIAGNTNATTGLGIGGTSAGFSFRGEIQEVQVFQSALSQSQIATNRFLDLNPASWSTLKGYFKLAYSTTAADQLKNFAATPPTGTTLGVANGTVVFEETNREGEQSLFDSRKNEGANAVSPLGGSYTWQQKVIGRPTSGIPFELLIGYNSSTALNGLPLDDGADAFAPQALGAGWRHSFETRMLPTTAFNPTSTRQAVGMLSWDGNVETWDLASFTANGVKFKTRHKEYRGELELVGSNFDPAAVMKWTTPDRLIYTFRTPYPVEPEPAMQGRLKEIADFNGNRIVLEYHESGDKAGLINRITDTGGGVWTFNYDATNLLSSVTGPSDDVAQKWTITFTYTTANNRNTLSTKSITGPAVYTNATTPALATQWQFFYTTAAPAPLGLLNRVVDPRGKDDTRVTYDDNGRKTTIKDAINRTTTFTYNSPEIRQLTTTAQSSVPGIGIRDTVDVFDRKLRRISTRQAQTGILTSFEYDEFGNTTAVIDPRGNRVTMTYDARSNVLTSTVVALNETTTFEYAHTLTGGVPHNEPTKVTNPLGWQTRYTFGAAGNVLTQADDLGTLVTHAYNAKGLVTSTKDGNNNETTFGYDAATGFLTSRTTAAGTPKASTSTVVPSELGWPLSQTNALNQTVSTLYNINGQPVRVTDPLNRQFVKTYDANGNLTSEKDAKGVATTHTYDDADQRVSMTDRGVNTWTYTYSPFGELLSTTSPAALSDGLVQQVTSTRTYDGAGRLTAETDPYGYANQYEYDLSSNVTATVDKWGSRWLKTYDALNRVITSTDPQSNVTRTAYDAAGRVKTITSPKGFPTQHEYDGRGRLKKWIDPMGASWLYTYDGTTNILDIEDALHGHYLMTYGPANERLTERNQDNQTWNYQYDVLFRLDTQTDPNGTTRTLARDAAGRTTSVTFGSGRVNSLTYDDNNNPVTVTRAQPGQPTTTLNLAYDAQDRLTSSTDTFGKVVGYAYDALSRVVTRTYPGGKVLTHAYDKLSRLRTHTFVFDGTHTFTSSYTFDQISRLRQQNYPNGLTQQNTFDNAGRITDLSHNQSTTPLIALTYAYDKNGNKTGGSEQGTVKWSPAGVAKYDDATSFTAAGKMIARTDSAPAVPKTFNYTYDASGNMTRAATPGDAEVYALAYDEDNRTTSISHTAEAVTTTIANRYDALGRRVSRILNGTETRYVLDLLGDMERILCDTDSAGSITAWHIHGPAGLSYKVAGDASLTCYHADAQGNIIRTTTTDGPDADTVPDTVNEYAYTPYGRRLVVSGPPGDPYRFVGSQGVMEELPNLYFMRARYYAADEAIFFGTDPLKSTNPMWTSSRFSYANANPLAFVDTTGLSSENGTTMTIGCSDKTRSEYGHCWISVTDSSGNETTYGTMQGSGLTVDREKNIGYEMNLGSTTPVTLSDQQQDILNAHLLILDLQGEAAWGFYNNCVDTSARIYKDVTGIDLNTWTIASKPGALGMSSPGALGSSIREQKASELKPTSSGATSSSQGKAPTPTIAKPSNSVQSKATLMAPKPYATAVNKSQSTKPSPPTVASKTTGKANTTSTSKTTASSGGSGKGPTPTAYAAQGYNFSTGTYTVGSYTFSITKK